MDKEIDATPNGLQVLEYGIDAFRLSDVAIPGDDRLFLRLRDERVPTIAAGDGSP